MSIFLGIDTSNYTTSCALYDTDTCEVVSLKRLLPVKKGEKGIRQSDAVFHHTKQLPELIEQLLTEKKDIDAVSWSCAPRNAQGSYMPCFLAGESAARSICAALGIKGFATHHQTGHILAALYSCKRLDLLKSNKSFVALHVSGGTTDMLLCRPDEENVLDITHIGGTLDLNAGQAVDRVGVALGIDFPCGPQLEMLAAKSEKSFSVKPVIKGKSCCLSGLENMCMKMLSDGAEPSDVARFCLEYIASSIKAITLSALDEFGTMPVIFAGGVMSNRLMRKTLCEIPDSWFAEPEFSCDNAVGVALFGAVKKGLV